MDFLFIMTRRLVWLSIPVLAVLAFSGCARGRAGGESVIVAGSTSIQPFADEWAEVYERATGRLVDVQGGGSSAGIQACRTATCQIGMSSRELKPDEKDLHETVVAWDGLAVIVHPSNPVTGAAIEAVHRIFAGTARRWSALGGAARDINVVTREEGSGTRGAFQEMVMGRTRIFQGAIVQDSNGTVREIVANDPCAIGYISLGLVDDRVRALPLDEVPATDENIASGRYPLVRPFLFLTRGEPVGAARDFVEFVLSPEGQDLVAKRGLIPAARIGRSGGAGEDRP